MSKTVSNNFRGTSTNLNPRYLMSLFVPTITVTDSNGKDVNVLEIFSSNMIKAIEAITPIGLEQFKGGQVTTLAFRRYNNTTCYWMVMLASKKLHPLLLQTGDLVNLPDIDAIRKSTTLKFTTGARIPIFTSI